MNVALDQLRELKSNMYAAYHDACDAIERFNICRKAFCLLSEEELAKAVFRDCIPIELMEAVRIDQLPPPIPDPEFPDRTPPPAAHAAAG